ncbi:hypothetical protein INT45_012426 [Circinella minor]|uniref:Uncharacterized protein n=1 Tax=Circinella minor TaxID=1195481 RepID=A0A8H7S2B6_9FUNG|nr:hypothetical protein INT45_012426 [Circinella minor]
MATAGSATATATAAEKEDTRSDDSESRSVIVEYIEKCNNTEETPSLRDFICTCMDDIVKLTDLRKNVYRFWATKFDKVLKDLNVEGKAEEEIDWSFVKEFIKQKKTQDATKTASNNIKTSSASKSTTKSAKLMTAGVLNEVKNSYEDVLKSKKVWKLESGRVVEEVMMNLALKLKYEHPIHSMIINPDDLVYADVFDENELDEIRNFKSIDFDQPLPEDLQVYLHSFIGKRELKELNSAIKDKVFDPLDEADMYWARQTIDEAVNLYNYKFFEDDYIEDDVEYCIWPFISKCFGATPIRARSGKRKSQASSARHNQKRSLSAHEPTSRHTVGMQPDMKCLYLNYEIGFSEVGLKDDGASGLHMSALIMDSPEGSVCRITQSERATFPCDADVCVRQLIPIIELVYRVRLYLMETVNAIKNDNQVLSLGKKGKKRSLIPPCIISPESSSSATTSNHYSSSSSTTTTDSTKKQKRQ